MPSAAASFNIPAMGLTNTPWATIITWTPADYQGQFMRCDDAPGGGALVYCDGVSFRPFARGSQRQQKTSQATGRCTWVYPQAFPAGVIPVPHAVAVNALAGQPYVVEVETLTITNTQCVFLIRQAIVAVLGLSVWQNAAAGVVLQCFADPPSAAAS